MADSLKRKLDDKWTCPNCGMKLDIDPNDKTPVVDPFRSSFVPVMSTEFEIIKREHDHYCVEIMRDPLMSLLVPGPQTEPRLASATENKE